MTPGHLATNPRLVKEADALVTAGYDVNVVAARFIAWADGADREFEGRPWAVKTIAFGALASPVPRTYRSLRRRAARRSIYLTGLGRATAERAIHWIVPELGRAACAAPADLYIAHNLAALPAACQAANRHRAMVGFDAEDLHGGERAEGPVGDFERRLVETLESHYLPRCDYVTAASPGIARAYVERHGISEPVTLLNVFPLNQAPGSATMRGTMKPGPSVYWFSQTIGDDRGLEAAVRAIGMARCRPHLYLRGDVSQTYRAQLAGLAREAGAIGQLHFAPPAAPGQMVRLAAEYDLGLAAETMTTVNRQLALSNKIFTYVLAGVPALVSATPAQTQIAKQMTGAAWLYPPDDASALANLIDSLLATPAALAAARSCAWKYGQTQFNWDIEQRAFVDLIKTVMERHRGPRVRW